MILYYILIAFTLGSGIYLCGIQSNAAGSRRAVNRGKICIGFYLLLTGALLTAVASLRYAIGFDYFSYRSIYENIKAMEWGQIIINYKQEILFYLACKLLSACGLSYMAFLLVVNTFLHSTAMWFIYRYSKIPWLSVYFYITLQFFAHNMNLLRQSIAAAFFLLAWPFLARRKFLGFLALITVGGLFHNSLFFALPLYFLLAVKPTKKYWFFMAASAALAYMFMDTLLSLCKSAEIRHYIDNYESSIYWRGNGMEYVMLPAVYFLLVVCLQKRLPDKAPEYPIYCNSVLFTLLIQIFITKHFILERFSIYPFLLSLLILPEIAYFDLKQQADTVSDSAGSRSRPANNAGKVREGAPAKRYAMKRYAILAILLLFGAVYFFFAAGKGYHNVYPYIGIWDKAISNGA